MIKEAAKKRMEDVAGAVEEIDATAVSPEELDGWLVIDVREDHEYADGHLPDAMSLPRSRLEMMAMQSDALEAAADKPALVYCATGKRSLFAAQTLKELGVKRPVSMKGGFKAWSEVGNPQTRE